MIETNTAPYAALLLRVTSGTLLLAHGWLKVSVFTVAGTVAYFESLGLPGALAYLTILAELGGGFALILGVATRVVALATLPVLIGATYVHASAGWLFSNAGGGWEFPAFWALVQVAIAILGGGAYALRLPKPQRLRALVAQS